MGFSGWAGWPRKFHHVSLSCTDLFGFMWISRLASCWLGLAGLAGLARVSDVVILRGFSQIYSVLFRFEEVPRYKVRNHVLTSKTPDTPLQY